MKVYTVFYKSDRGVIQFKRINATCKDAARHYVTTFLHVKVVSVE